MKIEETIVVRNNKMIYAVRLKSKLSENQRDNMNTNPYILVEDGKVKFSDSYMSNRAEFDFSNDVHAVAKEIFISGLQTAIKQQILELKQLELVFKELNLSECIGDSIAEGQGLLYKVNKVLGIGNGKQ
jgi:hypothetical protein